MDGVKLVAEEGKEPTSTKGKPKRTETETLEEGSVEKGKLQQGRRLETPEEQAKCRGRLKQRMDITQNGKVEQRSSTAEGRTEGTLRGRKRYVFQV